MRSFPCSSCGANVEFAPGTDSLVCPYCQATNQISTGDATVDELDFASALAKGQTQDTVEQIVVSCDACGATVTMGANVTADRCNFCDAPVVAEGRTKRLIKPGSVLPFGVTKKDAQAAFQTWLSSRWFAPSDLAKRAKAGKIDGTYLPFWTYDSETRTDYQGQRGDHYYEQETYYVQRDGEQVQETRTVQRTAWSFASGTAWLSFDDILVLASDSIPEKMTNELEPWDLEALVPYDDGYLSGFSAECYKVDVEGGFERAKQRVDAEVEAEVCRCIGGDTQRIHNRQTHWSDITFKHLLLPVWISAYRYNDKPFQFLVNARTKEVQGARPYSVVKITLAVLAGVALAIVIFMLLKDR